MKNQEEFPTLENEFQEDDNEEEEGSEHDQQEQPV